MAASGKNRAQNVEAQYAFSEKFQARPHTQ